MPPSRSPSSPDGSGRAAATSASLWRASVLSRVSKSADGPSPSSPPPPADSEEIARFLATDLSAGLSAAEVAARRAQVGPNALRGGGPPPLVKIIFQLSFFSFFSFFFFSFFFSFFVCSCYAAPFFLFISSCDPLSRALLLLLTPNCAPPTRPPEKTAATSPTS
jgi:hypothetical protein